MLILGAGILLAILLVRMGIVSQFIQITASMKILSSFVAGMFFTSVLTVAPASVALGALSTSTPLLVVAFWGACGAALVDYILFTFFRKDVSIDIKGMLKPSMRRRILSLFHHGFLKWLVVVSGALIIASPLPDELGLAVLSFSHVKTKELLAVTFSMNFFGILALTSLTRALL